MNIKLLYKDSIKPTKAHETDAGFDLYVHTDDGKDVIILPGDSVILGTGIAMEIPKGCFGGIYPRSGLASKSNVRLSNSVGVIDFGYTDEVKLPLYNDSNQPRTIKHGDRVAQLIVHKYEDITLEVVDSFPESERGNNGFGSSGV